MREFTVRFRSFRDIQDFVALSSSQPFRIMIGSDRYRVNATSFMGMFSLNCRKPLRVWADCTEAEYDRFLREAERFLES